MINRLRGKIIEQGYTMGQFADRIGMPRGSFSRKLNKETFTWSEVMRMADALGILYNSEELSRIFFAPDIHKKCE